MRKIILIIVLAITFLLFLTYDRFVRQYIHEDFSNHYTMHHLNGCSLQVYTHNENSSPSINYSCLNIENMNFQRDLSKLVSHFQLTKELREMQKMTLTLFSNHISFPVLLQNINNSRKWPKDFRNIFKKEKEGRDEYLELMADVINSSGYIERLGHAFSQYGCKAQLYRSGIMDFMEYHSDSGYPLFYTSDDLIKQGLIEKQEIVKKVYPMIDVLSLTCVNKKT